MLKLALAIFVSFPTAASAASTLNFYNDFCPRVETRCGKGSLEDPSCLKGIVNAATLSRKLKNVNVWLLAGFGADATTLGADYFSETTLKPLKMLGMPASKIRTVIKSSLTPANGQAEEVCYELQKAMNEKPEEKFLLLGHSKAGRVLVYMAYSRCPRTMASSQVLGILGVQSAIGGSALANPTEAWNISRWQEGMTAVPNQKWQTYATSKIAILDATLGKHMDEVSPNEMHYDSCPECDRKLFFVRSAWDTLKCDSSRTFGQPSEGFLLVKDGANDGRLPVTSHSHERVGSILADVDCASHSDFFKTSVLPKHLACQQAMNLWMFENLIGYAR